ncbi:hypothetical protein ACFL5H_00860 [Candidatus Latescibacterota bacterium]
MAASISEITAITTIVQNVILALSGVTTAILAYIGLSTWRKELKGKSEYAKAKEVLKAVYKVRRAFMYVRNPAIYQYEYPDEMCDHSGHLKEEHNYEGTLYVYENRLKPLTEAFQELEEQNLDAQVEWGPEFQNVIIPLRKCMAKIQITIQRMLEEKKNPHYVTKMSPEERAEESSVLYYGGEDSEHDKFTPKINAAIELFEKELRPHIKK